MNFNWLTKFKIEKPPQKNRPKPGGDTAVEPSEIDSLAAEWFSLSNEKMTSNRIAQILISAENGQPQEQAALFQMIQDREPVIAAHLQTRILAVTGCDWKIESENENDEAKTKDTARVFKKAGIHGLMRHLLDALGTGYAGSAIKWGPGGGTIEGFTHVNPTNWTFDQTGNPGIYTIGGEKGLNQFHPNQFIFHTHKMKPGIPAKGGILRCLVWLYLFKHYAFKDRARFLEKFGIPFVIAKVNNQDFDDDTQRARIKNALRKLGAEGVAVTTEGSEITTVTAGGGSANGDFHQFCADIDDIFAMVILGQTSSAANQPGKLGNDGARENVRLDIMYSDCECLQETINMQLLNPYEQFKYGTDSTLEFCIEYEPGEDLQEKAVLIKTLKEAGFSTTAEWASKTFDVPLTAAEIKPPAEMPALMDFSDRAATKYALREEFTTRITENTLQRLFRSPATMAEYYRPIESEIRKTFKDIDPEDPEIMDKFKSRMEGFFKKYPAIYELMDTANLEKALQGSMMASLAQGYTK